MTIPALNQVSWAILSSGKQHCNSKSDQENTVSPPPVSQITIAACERF